MVQELDGKHYQLNITKLAGDIKPDASYHKVKTGQLLNSFSIESVCVRFCPKFRSEELTLYIDNDGQVAVEPVTLQGNESTLICKIYKINVFIY